MYHLRCVTRTNVLQHASQLVHSRVDPAQYLEFYCILAHTYKSWLACTHAYHSTRYNHIHIWSTLQLFQCAYGTSPTSECADSVHWRAHSYIINKYETIDFHLTTTVRSTIAQRWWMPHSEQRPPDYYHNPLLFLDNTHPEISMTLMIGIKFYNAMFPDPSLMLSRMSQQQAWYDQDGK